MGYRLIQDEALSRGLRRIAREEIDSAVVYLNSRDAGKLDFAIHEARKSIKKLRGLLRMVNPEARADIAALGDLARALSEFRDAAAAIETVDQLAVRCPQGPAALQLAELRAALTRKARETSVRSDARAACEHAIVGLRRFRRSIGTWCAADSFDAIATGLERSYRRGRRALRMALVEPTGEHLHDLRKRVKDRWYQSRILEGLWTDSNPEPALRDLQEDLGDHNNLEVLRASITDEFPALREVVDSARRELRDRSLVSAAELYGGKPSEFVAELASLWESWALIPA